MKKSALLLLIFLSLGLIRAQEGEDVGWVARFGIAGGVNPAYLFPNMDALNLKAKNLGLDELSSSGMVIWGGGGYAYIMVIDNLRLGGVGYSGSVSSSRNFNTINRQLDYSFGLGGVTVEYTLPFINRVAVSVGTIIGVGSQSVEEYENSYEFNWDNYYPMPRDPLPEDIIDKQNGYMKVTNTFFTIAPTLNIDVPISRFIALRVGGGYIMNFNDKWKANNDRDISGVPESLTENNFFIQTGIYFGFFAF